MIMDWKDALGSLLQSGDLSEGDDVRSPAVGDTPRGVQKAPLHVLKERKGRAGKVATIVEGFECPDSKLQEVASRLKRSLGVGGSARGGEILIQGDLVDKVRRLLQEFGYRVK